MAQMYKNLGVSFDKKEVHLATQSLNKGIFPGAFCRLYASRFLGDLFPNVNNNLIAMHSDGTGSKSVLAYLYWKETGDLSIFKTLAQDALVMNIDDLLCVGITDHMAFTSTIARNKKRIPQEVLIALIEGTNTFIHKLNQQGFHMEFMGGETADIGDIVKTLTVDAHVFSYVPKTNVIDASTITPGLSILGIAPCKKHPLQGTLYNSNIASNGLTLARHSLLCKEYETRYPETVDDTLDKSFTYQGTSRLTDPLEKTPLTFGEALLSPTFSYLPLFQDLLPRYRNNIKGIIHCTGGGLSKCLHFSKGIHYMKDNLFPMPPLFERLSQTIPLKEMLSVFNCGHRMEIYTDEDTASSMKDFCEARHYPAKQIGKTHPATTTSNQLTITHQGEQLHYS